MLGKILYVVGKSDMPLQLLQSFHKLYLQYLYFPDIVFFLCSGFIFCNINIVNCLWGRERSSTENYCTHTHIYVYIYIYIYTYIYSKDKKT